MAKIFSIIFFVTLLIASSLEARLKKTMCSDYGQPCRFLKTCCGDYVCKDYRCVDEQEQQEQEQDTWAPEGAKCNWLHHCADGFYCNDNYCVADKQYIQQKASEALQD